MTTPNWAAYVDLRSSVGDQNAPNVLEIPSGAVPSPINAATVFSLIDIQSGAPVDATLQVDNSGMGISSENGGDFSAGPAFGVFDGIVDAQGVYSYADANAVWQLNIGGLDPSKRYEVVVSSNRNEAVSPERWTEVELLGAAASVEAAGGTTTVVSPALVRLQTRNNTARGDIARWTSIDPGADGAFSLASDLFLADGSDRSYAPVLLRLREFDGPLPPAPSVPTGLTVGAVSSTELAVSWNDVTGEDSYELQVSANGGAFAAVADSPLAANTVSYSATGLTAGTEYCYQIQATNTGGPSGFSSSQCATPLPPAPSVPTGLTVGVVSGTELAVSWNDVTGETAYELQVSANGGTFAPVAGSPLAANTTSYPATGLTAGTEYCYKIQATNTGGPSGFSSTQCATPPIPVPMLTMTGGSVDEGDLGESNQVPFTITLNGEAPFPVTVTYKTGELRPHHPVSTSSANREFSRSRHRPTPPKPRPSTSTPSATSQSKRTNGSTSTSRTRPTPHSPSPAPTEPAASSPTTIRATTCRLLTT